MWGYVKTEDNGGGMDKKKILVVDDHDDLRRSLCEFLEEYSVLEAASGEEALRILSRGP